MNSRASVVFRAPQDVEVLLDGTWVPGAMLGWRHDEAGGCEALVRSRDDRSGPLPAADGEGRWLDLAAVRLPERHLALAGEPGAASAADATVSVSTGVPVSAPTVAMAVVEPVGRPRRAGRRHGGDVTAEQPAVGVVTAGRHRAPADSGRHRALTAEMPAVTAAVSAAVPTPAAPTAGAEEDGLTRPIRLDDLVSHRGGRPAVRPSR
ncbi:hypothetical protein SAMN05660690_2649 [Geodermatophilus telluris]|uniref:Uncharacterized protein n=1 Tax=Geodermatophilus telluris TaxID=1190417 RepID=A0A1G6PLI4_9ACTN|nr:hypothetical protein SAMN05660690_2649 [Geodermatophilus telluris]